MKRIINIDWLSLYCLSSEAYYHQNVLTGLGYQLQLRGDGTRHFKKLYDVIMPGGDSLLEIQERPKSLKSDGGIWHHNAMLIKINNKQLYQESTIEKVISLLYLCQIKIKSISRLDLAMDFNYFDNHMHPQTMITKFMNDELWYIYSKKWTCIGKQGFAQRYEYLRFGSAKSSYTIYLYNKSRELLEQKDKAYIRDIWHTVGLNVKDVWRLEISLRTDAKAMLCFEDKIKRINKAYVNMVTGEQIADDSDVITTSSGILRQVERINIDCLCDAVAVQHLYMRLVNHLWHFREKEKGKKKSKATRVDFIQIDKSDVNYRPVRLTYGTTSGRTDRIVVNYLDKMVQAQPELLKQVYALKKAIYQNTGMRYKS